MTAAPRPVTLVGMIPPEPDTLDVLIRLAPLVAASGIWVFGAGMLVQNGLRAKAERRRAEAEKNRHTESMEAEKRRAEAEKNRHTESMTALSELIRRTSPPRPGPAE